MQIRLTKAVDIGLLTKETKTESKFLCLPIVEEYPLRLVWLEWVTRTYRKDIFGKWIKVATAFHGAHAPIIEGGEVI